MRRKKIILPNEKILSLLEERIMAGEAVRLPVRGYSMSPWLLDGRDTVILHPVDPARGRVHNASMTSAPRIDATPGMSPDFSARRPPVPAHVRQKVDPQAGRPLGQEQCRHLFGSDTSRH